MAKRSLILFNLLNWGIKKVNSFINEFGDPDLVFKARADEISRSPYFTGSDVDRLLKTRNSDLFDKELQLIEKENICCIDIFDKDYPGLLKEISSPPIVLYIRGNKNILKEKCFAVVGTRQPTDYGILYAGCFSRELSQLGLVITSGLARGIDTYAHKAALEKGKTIAVLGSGLLNTYPRENKDLAARIAEQGAVVSEFSLNASPLRENFPRRNRIVSGLSIAALVIEAAKRSGALITGHLAAEQNREVFALPGRIDSEVSAGTHMLIKEGAKLVTSLEDILEEINIESSFLAS